LTRYANVQYALMNALYVDKCHSCLYVRVMPSMYMYAGMCDWSSCDLGRRVWLRTYASNNLRLNSDMSRELVLLRRSSFHLESPLLGSIVS